MLFSTAAASSKALVKNFGRLAIANNTSRKSLATTATTTFQKAVAANHGMVNNSSSIGSRFMSTDEAPSSSNLFVAENLKALSKTLPILKIQLYQDEVSIVVRNQHLLPVLTYLKNHINCQFKVLTCLSGVDYPQNKHRFHVVYDLLSIKYNARLRVKVMTDELTPVESAGAVYPAASWYESETWDMYGIFFVNHTNLTRLLTDYGFEGYPLRKDFPLSGFVEVAYDYTRKRVTNERIELAQEYRSFTFSSPWETLSV